MNKETLSLNGRNKVRCINLDWFEVFCREDIEHFPVDANFFKKRGWEVKQREYGTPQYKEKFTLYQGGFPLYEIARNPYSLKEMGGIFEKGSCHIRICNRTLYAPRCIDKLREFLLMYNYSLNGVTRADVCLDFVVFDNQMKPQTLLNGWAKEKFRKINACFSHEHGIDTWSGKVINSVKWGSEQSMISTKMYNKTMELSRVAHDKFYIRDAWKEAGIKESDEVWRIEFSIKGNCNQFVRIEDPDVNIDGTEMPLNEWMKERQRKDNETIYIKNNLEMYDTKERLHLLFFSLYKKYFHWKIQSFTKDGNKQRKDRCKDLELFKYDGVVYKPLQLTKQHEPGRMERILIKHCEHVFNDGIEMYTEEEKDAAGVIINSLVKKKRLKEFCEEHGFNVEAIKTRQDLKLVKDNFMQNEVYCISEKERKLILKKKLLKQMEFLQKQLDTL